MNCIYFLNILLDVEGLTKQSNVVDVNVVLNLSFENMEDLCDFMKIFQLNCNNKAKFEIYSQ